MLEAAVLVVPLMPGVRSARVSVPLSLVATGLINLQPESLIIGLRATFSQPEATRCI